MKRILFALNLISIILGLIVFPTVVSADEAIKVADQTWEANFREHLSFTLKAESSAKITEVNLLYQVVGQLATSRNEAEFTPGSTVEAKFTIDQTKPENYMPPGTELQYWWKIVDEAGNELRTEKQKILYLDNRYEWQKLQNERVTLYWYQGNDRFGQTLFDRANLALDTLASDIGITLKDPIKVFIYGNHRDLLGALSASAQEWTGGQAFTTYGVVAIGVEPEQLEWGLRAMTHEMSHLVIHQATDNPYRGLPRWLDEGIAVYNEDPHELVSDFKPLFDQAVEYNQLMTLRSLASPFPADPVQANLAYGQSGAVVKFIISNYGSEAMAKLLSIFAEGALDDEALQTALGVDTDSLDNAFRVSLKLPPLPSTSAGEASTGAEAAPIIPPAEQVTVPAESSADQPDTKPAAAPALPPAEQPSKRPGLPFGLPCLAGLLLPGIMFIVFSVKRSTIYR
jgi:hypothetical protein